MALFEVPGWTIPTTPIQDDFHHKSKKRKLLSPNDPTRGTGPAIDKALSHKHPPTLKVPSRHHLSVKKKKTSHSGQKQKDIHTEVDGRSKKRKKSAQSLSLNQAEILNNCVVPLTDLQRRMKETLDGARFRLINETLYKTESREARRMVQQDPKTFEEYHVGFRHQVLSWPTNPVDHYIEKFSSYTPRTVIVDLGCGDAALAKRLLPKGISVISFDFVSDNAFVVEADVCDQVPLPGSEGVSTTRSTGEGQVIDVVVCALSLMGTNWVVCIREAWRILKANGELHVAEVTSRFTDIEQFVSLIVSIGFRFKLKDDSNTHFTLFEFSKVPRQTKSQKEWAELVAKGSVLKPCQYKRR